MIPREVPPTKSPRRAERKNRMDIIEILIELFQETTPILD